MSQQEASESPGTQRHHSHRDDSTSMTTFSVRVATQQPRDDPFNPGPTYGGIVFTPPLDVPPMATSEAMTIAVHPVQVRKTSSSSAMSGSSIGNNNNSCLLFDASATSEPLSSGGGVLNVQIGSPDLSRRSSAAVGSLIPAPVVVNTLYVGSYRTACDEALMRSTRIDSYLCAAKELVHPPTFLSADDVTTGHVTIAHFPMEDTPTESVQRYLWDALSFIDTQSHLGRRTLVYCQAGKSRSVSIALAYLMREYQVSVTCALAMLRQVHRDAEPNVFFLDQLIGLEAALHSTAAQREDKEEGG